MNIQFKKSDVDLTPALKSHVETRLGLALSRFAERIRTVIVCLRLGEHHSPAVIRCQIEVIFRKAVRVEEQHHDPFTAVDHAVERIATKVRRLLAQEEAAAQKLSGAAPAAAMLAAKKSGKRELKDVPKSAAAAVKNKKRRLISTKP